ncbi:B12-binding domain-containing radical SAM protein [Candidatus Margulisiibacteriota bacterium]
MKILLIRPPVKYVKGSARPASSLPVGLLYIAAVLEEHKYDVEIYDAQINIDQPIISDSKDNMHMGDSWEIVEEEIRKRSPELVGISGNFTAQMENVIRTAEIIKKVNNNIITIVGGNHPTVRPDDFFLKTKAVDLVCLGEAEYTMLAIADALGNRRDFKAISGTAVWDGGSVKINPRRPYIQDLDALPWPAYHLVNLEDYFLLTKKGYIGRPTWRYPGSERAVSVTTSRGCPFNCIFCSIHLHMGRKWRQHSAEYVLRHLEYLVDKYQINHIHFEDDNLTLNLDRFKKLLDGIIHKKLKITWDTPNGVRADKITEEILKSCKQSGCVYLVFGVESGNQEVLDKIINKRLDLHKVIEVAKWCKQISLDVMSFFVIGFPGETKENMQETVDFALWLQRKYDVNPGLFIATPLPGTELEAICREQGLVENELTPGSLAKMTQGAFLMSGDKFKTEDLKSS